MKRSWKKGLFKVNLARSDILWQANNIFTRMLHKQPKCSTFKEIGSQVKNPRKLAS